MLLLLCATVLLATARASADEAHELDEGILYNVVVPTAKECTQTFGNCSAKSYAVHVWTRCIGETVRGFAFIEDRDTGSPPSWPAVQAQLPDGFKFTIASAAVETRIYMGGCYFSGRVSTPDLNVRIGVATWGAEILLPTRHCSPVSPPRANQRVVAFSLPYTTRTELERVFEAIVMNIQYHRCAMRVDRFTVFAFENTRSQLLQHAGLRRYVEDGVLTVYSVGARPVRSPYFQQDQWESVFDNVLLLRMWNEDNVVFFIDTDEYMVMTPEALDVFENTSVVGMTRRDVFSASGADFDHLRADTGNWRISLDETEPKPAVHSRTAYAVSFVHSADGPKVVNLDRSRGMVYHLRNLYSERLDRSHKSEPVTWSRGASCLGHGHAHSHDRHHLTG